MYERKARLKRKRKTIRLIWSMRIGIILLVAATIWGFAKERIEEKVDASKPEIDVDLLDINPFSRPGSENEGVNGIVIHYTANPGSTAKQNRDYFEGLKDTHTTKVSSHFVVGLKGEIVQCIPTWEYAYASNERNADTISIECCHPDESGKFTDQTYRSVVQLSAWLCLKYGLDENDIIRHYDITGKNCPRYFVEHEDKWDEFKEDVKMAIERTGEKTDREKQD